MYLLMGVFDMEGRLKKRGILTEKKTVLQQIQIRTPHTVIPAQAGIQTLVFQKYLKIAVIPNLWIPACAGMTMWGVLI